MACNCGANRRSQTPTTYKVKDTSGTTVKTGLSEYEARIYAARNSGYSVSREAS